MNKECIIQKQKIDFVHLPTSESLLYFKQGYFRILPRTLFYGNLDHVWPWLHLSGTHLALSYGNTSEIILRKILHFGRGFFLKRRIIEIVKSYQVHKVIKKKYFI